MNRVSRREALMGLSALGIGLLSPSRAIAQTKARLVVVGGGFGGASAARRLKVLLPDSQVTLIEQNETYTACPFSNLVVSGERALGQQVFRYDALSRMGIDIIADRASGVDAANKTVSLENGSDVPFDRLILSPGIDFRWGALEGYDQTSTQAMPHAWKAGEQTLRLRAQLREMQDGGTVVMSVPAAPFRCPPGPYERASLIAHYLKINKPKSKLLILDAKDNFSKQPLFQQAWKQLYGGTLEWRGASDDGRVSRIDAEAMTLETDFETFQANVANVIPPQQAGAIAATAGVANETGWCPVNPVTFQSTLQSDIHVIGDAIIAAPMPKSAFSANLQAKVCATQIARLLAGLAPAPTTLVNTCYSFVSPNSAVSISGVYKNDGEFNSIEGAGGLSTLSPVDGDRAREANQARDWFAAITQEAFG